MASSNVQEQEDEVEDEEAPTSPQVEKSSDGHVLTADDDTIASRVRQRKKAASVEDDI
jgi:hypothetical protein